MCDKVRWFIVALLALSVAAPNSIAENYLPQFGLPFKRDAAFKEDSPEFMKNVYNCWNFNSTDNCLPFYQGKDVNQVQTNLGTGVFCSIGQVACINLPS